MSIATAITSAQNKVAAAYTSCNNMGATMPVPADQNLSNLPATIKSIPKGGDEDASLSDVMFYDYDGTVLYRYTKEEFMALTEMPVNPSHQGLIAQGWNFTLAEAKAWLWSHDILDIGCMFITSDGKTRIYIEVPDTPRLTPPLFWSQTVSEGVEVDWGDNSPLQRVAGTGVVRLDHTYAPGSYVLTMEVLDGTMVPGRNIEYGPLFGGQPYLNFFYGGWVRRVEIGAGVEALAQSAFGWCFNLESVTLPRQIQSLGFKDSFVGCRSLRGITIPSGVTEVPWRTFDESGVEYVAMPLSIVSVGYQAFKDTSLRRVVLPKSITEIGVNAFSKCREMSNVLLPSSLQTLGEGCFSECKLTGKLEIPGSVGVVPKACFGSCMGVTEVRMAEGITEIGILAFYNISGAVLVDIPASVTSIQQYAFDITRSLLEVHVRAAVPPTLGWPMFAEAPGDFAIYVPTASVEAYKTATNWSNYADRIVGE